MKTSIGVKIAGALLSFGLLAGMTAPAMADRDDWRNDGWKHRHCEWCRHHPRRCNWEHRARCGFDWDDHWRDRHHDRDWWEKHHHDWDDR